MVTATPAAELHF